GGRSGSTEVQCGVRDGVGERRRLLRRPGMSKDKKFLDEFLEDVRQKFLPAAFQAAARIIENSPQPRRPDNPQEAGFLQAIGEAPEDDVPGLIYADWLEEHGQPERAEFIRVQVELAGLPFEDERVSGLQARAFRLLSRHGMTWLDNP